MFRRGSKYGSRRTGGFHSKFEASAYQSLKDREIKGEIKNLKTQVQVYMTRAKILYKPDFSYEENGETVYLEAKGFETDVWRIKRRLWKYYGPGKLIVVKGSRHSFDVHEVIEVVHD